MQVLLGRVSDCNFKKDKGEREKMKAGSYRCSSFMKYCGSSQSIDKVLQAGEMCNIVERGSGSGCDVTFAYMIMRFYVCVCVCVRMRVCAHECEDECIYERCDMIAYTGYK